MVTVCKAGMRCVTVDGLHDGSAEYKNEFVHETFWQTNTETVSYFLSAAEYGLSKAVYS